MQIIRKMLSQRIKYTYQVISKYVATIQNFMYYCNESEKYYESTSVKSEFWRKR